MSMDSGPGIIVLFLNLLPVVVGKNHIDLLIVSTCSKLDEQFRCSYFSQASLVDHVGTPPLVLGLHLSTIDLVLPEQLLESLKLPVKKVSPHDPHGPMVNDLSWVLHVNLVAE